MKNDVIKIDKMDIDFDNIYETSQIPTGTGKPVNALPEWWDNVDSEVGTLYMDTKNGLVYEVQSDGSPVAMGFLGPDNYNNIMDKYIPEQDSTPETEPDPGNVPNPGSDPNPESDPNPGSDPNPSSIPGGSGNDGFEYGYYSSEIAELVDAINQSYRDIENFATGNTGNIKTVASEYWEGEAEIAFERLIEKDADTYVKKTFELFAAAITEINNAGVDDQNFDKSLMDNVV